MPVTICNRPLLSQQLASHKHPEKYVAYRGSNGQKIARMQQQLQALERQENQIKNSRQDRKKFMSAKNVYSSKQTLSEIAHEKEQLCAKIKQLQEQQS